MPKHWMQKAFANAHGQFKKKAQAAGESTSEFANENKGAGGLLGRQANLAAIGIASSRKRKKKANFEWRH